MSRAVQRPGEFGRETVMRARTQLAVRDVVNRVGTAMSTVTRNAPPAAPLVPLEPVAGIITRRAPAPTAPTPSTTQPPAGGMTPGWETQLSPVGVLPTFETPVAPPPAAPIIQPAPQGSIITTTATPPAAPLQPSVPMSLNFGSGPQMRSSFSTGIDLRTITGGVVAGGGLVDQITQGVNEIGAAVNTVKGWFGKGTKSAAPSIPAPSGSAMPGVGTMGFVSPATIGKAAGAVGRGIGAIAGSKKVRGIVGGIAGWWLVDKLTGAILGPADPPRRRMNHLNPKALARANRRVCGFRDIAAKSLRQYGYTVSSTRSPRSCKPKKRKSCR
jgi:hypothetical protein